MNAMRLFAAAIAVLASGVSGWAATPEAPRGATGCSGCHATRSGIEGSQPQLNGRNPSDTVSAMMAFKSGRRPATVMDRIARGFSDPEINAIAEWWAGQNP